MLSFLFFSSSSPFAAAFFPLSPADSEETHPHTQNNSFRDVHQPSKFERRSHKHLAGKHQNARYYFKKKEEMRACKMRYAEVKRKPLHACDESQGQRKPCPWELRRALPGGQRHPPTRAQVPGVCPSRPATRPQTLPNNSTAAFSVGGRGKNNNN